jgi:CRISPR/Cas system CSM-associated protein Csm3 (group 7 of RAMP superfamily)
MFDVAPPLTRIDLEIPLLTLSPLHIGTGESVPDERLRGEENETSELAMIQIDDQGDPWIPGSALKGALRAAAGSLSVDDKHALFGTITDGALGRMGSAMIRGARLVSPGVSTGLPYADTAKGTYISSRTAIDERRGIAARNRLFHREMVAPGARFKWRIRLETSGDAEALLSALARALAPWSLVDGLTIGSESASGLGRVRIDGDVLRHDWELDPEYGKLTRRKHRPVTIPEAVEAEARRGVLTCEGPFLTVDPSWDATARQVAKTAGAKDEDTPHLKGVRRNGLPFITGEAVSGALRSRYQWRAKLAELRKEAFSPTVTHLFGETGRKAVLAVMVVSIKAGGNTQTTSVKLDRFSGGPIDNALFSIDGDHAVQINLKLSLDSRSTNQDPAALDEIVDDLRKHGLRLGHGSGRGFGWFRWEDA